MNNKVSICCLCYNHSKYIKCALDSFISQKFKGQLEIIVFDDCSTDNSREIINDYQIKHPNIIKTIFPKENTYSQGKTTFFDMINVATGDFLAFCEGDDYWIDNSKIEKQLNYLLINKDVNLVFHPAMTLLANEGIVDKGYGYYGSKVKTHAFEDILAVSGGYMPMASIFARKNVYTKWLNLFPVFFSENMWHSTIQILGTFEEGAGYLPDKMSVYRKMHEGSWSHTMTYNTNAVITDFQSFVIRNRKLNVIFENKYKNIFDKVLMRKFFNIPELKQLSFRQKKSLLKNISVKLSFIQKAKFFLLCIIYSVVRYVKK